MLLFFATLKVINTTPDSRLQDLITNLNLIVDVRCSRCLKGSSHHGGRVESIFFASAGEYPNDEEESYECVFAAAEGAPAQDRKHDQAAGGLFIMNMINIPRENFNLKHISLQDADSEILRHIGHNCKDLRFLELDLTSEEPHDFSVGFENLSELRLNGFRSTHKLAAMGTNSRCSLL